MARNSIIQYRIDAMLTKMNSTYLKVYIHKRREKKSNLAFMMDMLSNNNVIFADEIAREKQVGKFPAKLSERQK